KNGFRRCEITECFKQNWNESCTPLVMRLYPASAFRSNRFGLRREMELFHFQRRRQRSASALRFRAADPLGRSNHLDVSGGQQFQNALVEAEVSNRILNLSLLDEPNTVPRQPGQQSCPRIDAANIPETTH